jgi:hypothetical protein
MKGCNILPLFAFFARCAQNEHIWGSPSLSVHMIQFENHWTDLDEIWYGHYAIEGYPKLVLFNF